MCREAEPRPSTSQPITVIIPAHNRAKMLERALSSVWAQTPILPDEVIVVDDASDDGSADVARQMNATVIQHPENYGPAAARNTGLQAASHSWIALLDSDDEWLPRHLAELWELRHGHVLVSGSALRCGKNPAAARFDGPLTRKPLVLRSADQLVYPSNIVNTSGALIRRDLALELGGFSPDRKVAEDFDMWLRLLEHGTGICSPRVTVIKHLHDDQISQDQRMMQRETCSAVEAHRQRVAGPRRHIRRMEGVMAWNNLRAGLRSRRWRQAARWLMYIVARPQRLVGVFGIFLWRRIAERRSAELRGNTPDRLYSAPDA